MSFWLSFRVATPHRVVSWGGMSRAHGSALDDCFCLRCPCLMVWSHLVLSCRVQNLHLQLLVCQKLQSVLTPLHRSEDRASMPVSFPEGMESGRPRSGLSMHIFFIEKVFHGITVKARVPWRGRSCVRGVCVGVSVVSLVRPCVVA